MFALTQGPQTFNPRATKLNSKEAGTIVFKEEQIPK